MTVILCLILAGLAVYIYQRKVDEEIAAAQQKTEEALILLDQAQRRTAIKELELSQVVAQSDNAKKVADQNIADLSYKIDRATDDLKQVIAEKAAIALQLSTIELSILPDVTLGVAVEDAAVLYPTLFSGGAIPEDRIPELIQLMNLEVTQRRELAVSNELIIAQQEQQLDRKDGIITEYQVKEMADLQIQHALEDANEALRLENNQYIEVNKHQAEQIRLWENKGSWKWFDNVKLGVAIAVGFAAGSLAP